MNLFKKDFVKKTDNFPSNFIFNLNQNRNNKFKILFLLFLFTFCYIIFLFLKSNNLIKLLISNFENLNKFFLDIFNIKKISIIISSIFILILLLIFILKKDKITFKDNYIINENSLKTTFDLLNNEWNMDIAKIAFYSNSYVRPTFIATFLKLIYLDIIECRINNTIFNNKKFNIFSIEKEEDLTFIFKPNILELRKEEIGLQELDFLIYYFLHNSIDWCKINIPSYKYIENTIDSKYLNKYIKENYNRNIYNKIRRLINNVKSSIPYNISIKKIILPSILAIIALLLSLNSSFLVFPFSFFFILFLYFLAFFFITLIPFYPSNYSKNAFKIKNKIDNFEKYIREHTFLTEVDVDGFIVWDQYLIYAALFDYTENALEDIEKLLIDYEDIPEEKSL